MEEPKIEYENGYAMIRDVEIKITRGIYAKPASQIVRECRKYENRITFIPKNDITEIAHASGISILELLMMAAMQGSKLDILVENLPGTNPENIAKRLYMGITTLDEDIDFER
jgi:phosphotransferase system HPr (HPr) family protein